METMLIDSLQRYLFDTRQIDALAQRQVRLICRSIKDGGLRDKAKMVFLLALAALQNGSPRADREHLLKPVSPEIVAFHADSFCNVKSKKAPWFEEVSGSLNAVSSAIDALFADPDLFAPVSGREPADSEGPWPILVTGNEYIGFSRYWASVKKLEETCIPSRLNAAAETEDTAAVKTALHQVFIEKSIFTEGRQFHFRQIAAAALACRFRFCIISGGPGTGKTKVVLQIIRTLLRVYPAISPDRIVLCAPTGRAKARLGESLDADLDELNRRFPDAGDTGATVDGSLTSIHRKTLHSLLGQRPDGTFRYNRANPLPFKVVIVDEASMVDLNLFAALLEALPDECRLLLVGDMHQLPSVEAGALLGDLTECFSTIPGYAGVSAAAGNWINEVTGNIPADGNDQRSQLVIDERDINKAGRLVDHVIILTHSYRSSKTILDFAHAINRGDADTALALPAEDGPVSINTTNGIAHVESWCRDHFKKENIVQAYTILNNSGYAATLTPECIAATGTILFESAILSLAHEGKYGRRAINALAGRMLREMLGNPPGDRFFHGQPVILGSNHHDLDLYNGDLGIVVHTGEGTKVCFSRGATCRLVALDRLKDPEPAFALTVHKAQGSEFNEVLLVLPEKESPLLTRQILYTGVTRAKNRVRILGTREILSRAIRTREQRFGGVRIG